MKQLIMRALKLLWYAIAIGLIVSAILVSIARLVTPVLDVHREDVETWASQFLGSPVKIENVTMNWYRYHPEIILNHVKILNNKTYTPELEIKQVKIFFSVLQSVISRKPTPASILISGTQITVNQNAAGEMSIQGFPVLGGYSANPFEQKTNVVDILNRISLQPNLFLENIDIRYVPQAPSRPLSLHLEKFKLINSISRHVVFGKVFLMQNIPTALTVAVRWDGYVTHFSDMTAKIYCYFEGVSLPQWLGENAFFGLQPKQGLVSAKIWATWQKGQWEEIQSQFTLYSLSLYSESDHVTHKINRITGHIGWHKEGEGHVLAGDNIFIDFPNHLWPDSAFYLYLRPNQEDKWLVENLNIHYLDLKDIQPIILSTTLLTTEQKEALSKWQLQGELLNAKATQLADFSEWTNINLNTEFDKLSFVSGNPEFAVKNAAGTVQWTNAKGIIDLKSKKTSFIYTNIFSAPLFFDEITGQIQAEMMPEKNWSVQLNALALTNADLKIQTQGSLNILNDTVSNVNLTSEFTLSRLKNINQYLPVTKLDPELMTWLKAAFSQGQITGNAILRGQLSDFPFDKTQAAMVTKPALPGMFMVTSKLTDVSLHYAPGWPELMHANGTLIFSGRSMTAELSSGEVGTIPVSHVKGVIPYLGEAQPQILQLDARAEGDLSQGMHFIQTSPLNKKFKSMGDLMMSGPMQLYYTMTMPLSDPAAVTLKGNVEMAKAYLGVPAWELGITDLSGAFTFTENSLEAPNLQGTLFNAPANIVIKTLSPAPQSAIIQANITSKLAISELENWLHLPLSKTAAGETNYTATVNLSEQAPVRINLTSDLQGITINLPEPFQKQENVPRTFTLDLTAAENNPTQVKLDYDDLLSAAITLSRGKKGLEFIGGELHLGKGEANWPKGPGLYISANLDEINLDQLQNYAVQFNVPVKTSAPSVLSGIQLTASKIDLFGMQFTNLNLHLTPKGALWDANINSQEVRGQITLAWPLTRSSRINANFQRLNINSALAASHATMDPSTLPQINFVSDSTRYNQIYLGRVSFQTMPASNGLEIQSLRMSSGAMNLQASGAWTGAPGHYVSSLDGRLTSSNATEVLRQWNIDASNIVLSTGQVDFNLNWNDAPFNPAINSLAGDLSFSFGKGRIVGGQTAGAKMGLGKMLSLFSLQTLPRRLSLDFSDLFQQGYSFDSFKGNFVLDNGRAHAKNMAFDGPMATVRVYGNIGLTNKTYDLTLSITPNNVTSSLPVAATILTGMNPLVGVAAFVANSVIGKAVSRATMYYYRVTGTWADPQWQEVSRTEARGQRN